MTETTHFLAANENADPFATVPSSLDWLYLLRRELLKRDVSAMSLEQRRSRDEALKKWVQTVWLRAWHVHAASGS